MTKTRITEDILKSGEIAGPEFEKAKKVMINGGADMTKILNSDKFTMRRIIE